MNLIERIRLERAVQSYSWWLDLRGASGRRRRGMRRELRANLFEATSGTSAREAVRRLGSLRVMAAEAVPVERARPRWNSGLQVAVAALMTTLLVEVLAALAWLDGAMTAAPERAVTGPMTLFPGSSLAYEPEGAGFSLLFEPGWLCLAVGLVAFVGVARPWRVVRARTRKDRGPVPA